MPPRRLRNDGLPQLAGALYQVCNLSLTGRGKGGRIEAWRCPVKMFIILGATFLSGVLTSYLLLLLQMTSVIFRYPLAVFVSYLAFLGFMRLWLYYISPSRKDAVDSGSSICDFGGDGGSMEPAPVTGHGGEFGGGGASGSFDGPSDGADSASLGAAIPTGSQTAGSTGSSGGSLLGDIGDAVGGSGDSDSSVGLLIVVVIVAAILIAAIFGTIGFLIWQGSSLLCQVAFQFLLAANLRRRSKTIVHPGWCGSVLRLTWKPFGMILLLVILLASLIQIYFADCTKLSDVIRSVDTLFTEPARRISN
jgi:hypothetical protein